MLSKMGHLDGNSAMTFVWESHCPRTVGTPYFVSATDCLVDQTTIFVNPTSDEK